MQKLSHSLLTCAALLLSMMSSFVGTEAKAAELEWCLDHFPPRQEYLPGQPPRGPMVDMMQKLAQQSGFTLKFSPPTPSARCLMLMKQGKTDLMTGLMWSEQREQYMLLLPFDQAKPETLFVHKDRPMSDEDALRNRQIALVKNRTYSKGFIALLEQQQVNMRTANDLEQAMAMLHFKQVDAVAGPLHLSQHLIKHNPRLHSSIRMNPWQPPSQQELQSHLALSRMSPHFALHLQISQQLEKLVEAKQTHFYQ
jgi:polar amino acid transport system substrate-binding protein